MGYLEYFPLCPEYLQDSPQEEETNTVVPPHVENTEDIQDVEENIPEGDEIRSNQLSPPNSLASSKTTKLKGRSYQARKKRINNLLDDVEADSPSNHSEHLEKQASLLSSMLKSMEIDKLLVLCETEPDFFTIFGETEDDIHDWRQVTEIRIEDLLIKASKEVAERKAATQSGFKKLSYPSFNGDVLNYLEFKKRWKDEVVPERKPVVLELAALREAVPVIAKAKITDVSTVTEAWKVLDMEYGDVQEIRAKLKDQVRSIKIKATGDSARLVELYHAVQTIAAKIKASGSLSILENDEEYIALVTKHLPKDIVWRWCKKGLTGWSNFFAYLEKNAQVAKKVLTTESINAALSAEGDKPTKCSSCHKNHSGRCLKPKNAAVVNQGAEKTCPVCKKTAHKYQTKNGKEGISKRVKDCPDFKSATDDKKQEMVKKLKEKHPVCSKCSGWSHKTEACFLSSVADLKSGQPM